jgi:hypothetical protein
MSICVRGRAADVGAAVAGASFLLACEEILHLAIESVVSNARGGVSLWFRARCVEDKPVEKIRGDGLTGRGFALFCKPRWTAGLL